jgi:opacity protein-like surface antigen
MKKLFLAVLLMFLSACAFAQQDYVGRYDVFAGYSYLGSPKINLSQRGFNLQAGVNLTRWLAFGLDYSNQDGRGTLVPSELKPDYATDVNDLIALGEAAGAGLPTPIPVPPIPANYYAYVPFNARTQTFAAGPQLMYRHFKKVTLFIHPSIGAIHEHINLEPHDAFTTFVAGPTGALVASGILQTTHPSDTTYFYGLGGGADFNATKHIHLRADIEYVHVFLFSDLLAQSRNSVRLSIGPTFSFGKNVSR